MRESDAITPIFLLLAFLFAYGFYSEWRVRQQEHVIATTEESVLERSSDQLGALNDTRENDKQTPGLKRPADVYIPEAKPGEAIDL